MTPVEKGQRDPPLLRIFFPGDLGYRPRMKKFLPLFVLLVACADASYVYNFDILDPGAKNLQKPGERDVMEDADLKAELLLDPTSFQAIAFDVTNKTEVDLVINWDQVSILAPDGSQTPIHPDASVGAVQPTAKVAVRLVPFTLPATGKLAAAYDNTKFELVVPMVVRGQPKEYRYHLIAHTKKL
jgi:hypothetical protein